MQPVSFQARDGLTIYGYLTLPQKKQLKNIPLVLYVHGGPWERDTWGYNEFVQYFSNRGYACLQVNFRGSIGYGKQFINAGDREWAGKMHSDLIDAVAWAVKEHNCDPTKVAIVGMSYGGYAALVGATFTPDVFCCAVDLWGPSNLVTLVRSITSFSPSSTGSSLKSRRS
jgi:dipeptidyl aminopeptidase/acylaminoacyl peptidase